MQNQSFIKTFLVAAAIEPRLIVTLATAEDTVELANAAGDVQVGVTTELGSESNGRCDVIMGGIAKVKAGAAVAKGARVRSDANGKAIGVAATTDRIVGIALTTAAEEDDIISVFLTQL